MLQAIDNLDLDSNELDLSGLDEFDKQNQEAAETYQREQPGAAEGFLDEEFEDESYREPKYLYDPEEETRSWPPKKRNQDGYDLLDDPEIDFNNF